MRIIFIFLLLFFIQFFLSAQPLTRLEKKSHFFDLEQKSILFNGDVRFSESFFNYLFLENSVESLFDAYYEPVMNQFLSTGDFSFSDNYVFTFLGNSWLWNNYYYNNIKINDVFFTGKTYHKLPPVGNDLILNAITGSLNQERVIGIPYDFFYQQISLGGIGGHVPFYNIFFDSYTQQAPQLHNVLPEERKKSTYSWKWYNRKVLPFSLGGQNYFYIHDLFMNVQRRNFFNFDENGFTGTFLDSNINFSTINEIYSPTTPNSRIGFLTSYQFRDRLFSEFYFKPEATANYNSLSFTTYYKKQAIFSHQHGLTLATKDIKQNTATLGHNIFDTTGEGLDPFYPSVNTLEISQTSQFQYQFDIYKEGFIKLNAKLDNAFVYLNPKRKDYFSYTYFKSENNLESRSLYISEWTSDEVSYFLFANGFDIKINDTKKKGFNVYGELGFDISGFSIISEENLIRVSPFFSWGMNILNNSRHFLQIKIGRINVPFSHEFTSFLADGYQSAKNYFWEDTNNNLTYELGEKSDILHSTTGGAYHQIDKNFIQPHYYYLDIPYNLNVATANVIVPTFFFATSLHYRIFKNQVWVKASKANQGKFENINGKKVYFPSYGEKSYVVYNLPREFFPIHNRNWFNDSPFYLGGTIKLGVQGLFFYVSLSFTTYLINGITTLGNGPLFNSGGSIAESQADPNQLSKNVGRLDGDRSYIGRLLFNIWPLDFFSVTATLKYQDGQPIGKWGYYISGDPNNNNISFLRENVSGDNLLLYNGEFGTRDDALWIFDLKFLFLFSFNRQKDFSFYINFYNLLDLGRSILEKTFFEPNKGNRDVQEIQIPRGIQIGIRYEY